MKTNKRWFIIHGRKWGDDDDSCLRYLATSADEAEAMFKEEMGEEPKLQSATGEVFVLTRFDCGAAKPECI